MIKLAWLTPFLFFITCNSSNQGEELENKKLELTNIDQTENKIDEIWHQFSSDWNAFDAQSCAGIYTKKAQIIPPNWNLVIGKDSIQLFFQSIFDQHLSGTYHHQTVELKRFGSMAIEYAEFSIDWVRQDSTNYTYNGRASIHWERNQDGVWKIERYLHNNPRENYEL
ncbi:MAG: DUF4440 domain-containing protein [Cryomorphaceae bacterium]|nr:DUF4440 domain-containing protein [Cryomorphaceae bacterium]